MRSKPYLFIAMLSHDMAHGPGGAQVLLQDPSGNLIELFQPGARKTGG
jgi:hypothetical protein